MLRFSLRPLITAEVNSDTLGCLELLCYFRGEAAPRDLEIDDDQATQWYVENIVDEADREGYNAEPQTANDEMSEWFSSGLLGKARERADVLGENYPFSISPLGKLILNKPSEISTVSHCYLALQFFRILTNGFVEIHGATAAEIAAQQDNFRRHFTRLFEFIAGYAVSGAENGNPYMTSHCRSANDLHAVLSAMCRRVGGGAVLDVQNWGPVHAETNDGGVDCLVHSHGPGVPGNARLLLVGATIQKAAINTKIMGQQKLNFFAGFFQARPAAFQGVLVQPIDEQTLTRHKCVNENCLLYAYDKLWRGFSGVARGAARNQALRLLDMKSRKLLRDLAGIEMSHLGERYTTQPIC